MFKPNTNNYRTKYSKISQFHDFTDNISSEKDDLESVKRSYDQDHDSDYEIPNLFKYKYNRVTRKIDDKTKAEVLDELEEMPNPKKEKEYTLELENLTSFEDFTDTPSNEVNEGPTSYMFFNNLKLIHKLVGEMLTYDEEVVNSILDHGHNWAEDHMSVAKEAISHVRNYFVGEVDAISESYEGNYMFFGNLVCISDMIEEIMDRDPNKIDTQLREKHDWAEDHISAAKENVTQVYDFLKNEIK